jgi:Tol biopolymer transport system component
VRYTKIRAFAGKNDIIEDTAVLDLSPNGKFLLTGKLVVPIDGSEPFNLVDTAAYRGVWLQDGKHVALDSGGAICLVPVSPETGRPTGPAKKLLDGNYQISSRKKCWSPDGRKLVFSREGDIWTLSVKDGTLTQITNDLSREEAPAWSLDGKTIVYRTRTRELVIWWMVPAEGGTPRKISIDELRLLSCPRSPDGKWLFPTNRRTLRFFRLADKQVFEISPPEEVGNFFSRSPDEKKMLFYRPSYDYKYDLKVVSASGGPPIDPGGQVTLHPWAVWSTDSKRIATKGQNDESEIAIWIMSLSGNDPVPLQMDVSVDGSPFPFYISPNNKNLVFGVDRDDGTEDLFVVPISLQDARTTGAAIRVFDGLHRGLGTNVTVSWSPDGQKLAVIHRGDVWIASSDGSKAVQITRTPEMEVSPGWSPDGKMINYTIMYSRDMRPLYVVPASGGKAAKVLDTCRTHAWSPDGKGIAVVSNDMISLIPIEGAKPQEIAKLKDLGLNRVFWLSWSPDGKYIACVGNHNLKGDSGPIFVIPVEGGKATTLVTNDTSCKYWLSWSPDGKWISYDSEGSGKVRSEGTMWEADIEEISKKLSE